VKTEKIIRNIQTFLSIIRFRNRLMTFIGVIVGASFIDYGNLLTFPVLIAAVSAFILTGAGNVINDYYDYEIDKINRPDRALPSKRINKSDAWMLALTMFAIGLGISKLVNSYCLGIAALNAIVLVAYGKYSKKMFLLSNLIVSYLVGSIFVYGAFSNTGNAPLNMDKFLLIAVISICAFFATLAREIVKDIEDMEGDRKKASTSLPIRLGESRAHDIASMMLLTAVIISLAPFLLQPKHFSMILYGVPMIIADATFLTSLSRHPSRAQKMMITGMAIAIIAFFAGELGTNFI